VTTTIRFVTFVIKLPIRHPVLVAKQVASVAVLTGNRFGSGWGRARGPRTTTSLDVPWEGRGKRMDESIAVIRGLLAGGYAEYHGSVYDVPAMKMTPALRHPSPSSSAATAKPPCAGPPTAVTGGCTAAAIRAALPGLLERLGQLRVEAGRQNEPFETHVISLDAYSVDGVKPARGAGRDRCDRRVPVALCGGPDTEPLQTKLDNLRRFADTVIAGTRTDG
jgi:hypothetical protein